ncbi:Ribosomal protein S5 domain 2-type fold [Pseudocohnilembus persalinus]|uniref:Ribosomal protein S5 domain 2-type fold n=1 Tax=Pseudocohnilembus persalinus TaxID=266149 RepID=A0A0V0QHG9_PSEPJ|nr:Ribosomal protein S5 domain 2-type fold [Pseudocohnilembus persalinus]|eukprot:KRX01671.1 Ribosomal protein S5 domain 2-type fold [Pseudocohnilembus persalinus]
MKQQQKKIPLKKTKLFDHHQVIHIQDIYKNLHNIEKDKRALKYVSVLDRYKKQYGEEPEYFIRAPAIAKIFGEQTLCGSGYNRLSFPLEQDIIIAVGKSEKVQQLNVQHMQQTLYPQQTFEINHVQEFKLKKQDNNNNNNQVQVQLQDVEKVGDQQEKEKIIAQNMTVFYNLFLIGYKSAFTGVDPSSLVGINYMIDLNFPYNQGLGFSNAYTVAVALASLAINKHVKPNYDILLYQLQKYKKEVVQDMQTNDPDGLEQLQCLTGESNTLNYFDWKEKQMKEVNFPELDTKQGNNMVFIIVDSLTEKVKVMSQGHRIDKRMFELRAGIYMILQSQEADLKQQFKNLRSVAQHLSFEVEEMIECVNTYIKQDEYTAKQIEEFLQIPLVDICMDLPNIEHVINNNQTFNIKKVLLHYLEEEIIAQKVIKLLENEELEGIKKWEKLGQLMNDSYKSQKNNLKCASENIQKLVDLMKQLGCQGAKILGKGWDGLVIGLVQESKVEKTLEFLMDEYYLKKENKLALTDDIDYLQFKSYPSCGAKLLDPQYEIWSM